MLQESGLRLRRQALSKTRVGPGHGHPAQAAANASNWAFFICDCNGFHDDAA